MSFLLMLMPVLPLGLSLPQPHKSPLLLNPPPLAHTVRREGASSACHSKAKAYVAQPHTSVAQGVVNVLHSLATLRRLDSEAADRSRRRPPVRLLPLMHEGSLAGAVSDDLLYLSMQLLPDLTPQVRACVRVHACLRIHGCG